MRFHLVAAMAFAAAAFGQTPNGAKPVRVAVAGLVHGHVAGFFRLLQTHPEVELAGVFDPDVSLHAKYEKQFNLPPSLFYTSLDTMLDRAKPQAVAAFTNTYGHASIVEACARRHIHTMMEKPMAVDMEQARKIRTAAANGGIQVIVNYETTWYPSHAAIWEIAKTQRAAGELRKMVAMDGHQGPKEIGVGPEFLNWLRNPKLNGAGALFDFGCYGANLMTWLMDNQRPVAVTAVTQHFQPQIYPDVDDEANVLVEYPSAIGIIQGSWNWPVSRKDLEVYGERGYAIATGGTSLRVRLPGLKEEARAPAALPPAETDSVSYLTSVVRGERKSSGLSSIENNMIVVEILSAARESAATGKRVPLKAQ